MEIVDTASSVEKFTYEGEESAPKLYKWITKEYFEEAFRKFHKDNKLVLQEFEVKPAVGKGENYAGIIDRVFAVYQTSDGQKKSCSVILKYYFENDEFADMAFGEYMIFDREMSIYEKITPVLNSYLEEIKEHEKIFANAICVDFKNQSMILEDLSVKKYITADRVAKLDMVHAKMVVRKLAFIHATSALMEERNPGTFKDYDRGFFNKYTNTFENVYVGNLKALTNLVATWGPEYKYYKEKLEKLQRSTMKKGLDTFTPKESDFNCFVHGDIWTPNAMFTYDSEGKPTDAVLIDFQYAFWGSPATDLHYFVNSSCKRDVRFEREEELVQYYLYQLVDALKRLNYKGKIPSLHDFVVQYEDKRFYGEFSFLLFGLSVNIYLQSSKD